MFKLLSVAILRLLRSVESTAAHVQYAITLLSHKVELQHKMTTARVTSRYSRLTYVM